ncbi:MAG: 4-hydroxy-tetrahydrodipicolinate synthase [Cyclobacteriaceae bacterium]
MLQEKLKGTGVALVTPFNKDFTIDFQGLKKVLEHVSAGMVDYLVVLGSTGEAATIAWDEKLKILEFIISNNVKKLPVVMGLGGNNTVAMEREVQALADFPIDAILTSSPHYNKPTQKGIIAHYQRFADASAFPVILYNVPSRTGSNMTSDTTIELSKHNNIIGIKEASGDLNQCSKIVANADDDFMLISGDDGLTFPMISLGAHGVISVIANLFPAEFSEMVKVALSGNTQQAMKLNQKLIPSYELVSLEGNPVSLKVGMKAHGIIDDYVRLPLVSGSAELFEKFKENA